MNRLDLGRRTQIINCLVEGNSIRSTERMTETHRDTIMRLLVEVGTGCAAIMDEKMRMANRVRLSTDGLNTYVDAVERAFGADVDYGQAVKFYEAEPMGPGRYSPPKVVGMER